MSIPEGKEEGNKEQLIISIKKVFSKMYYIKTIKNYDKRRILKVAREKRTITCKEKPIKLS